MDKIIKKILKIVADDFNVSVADVVSPIRRSKYSLPRQLTQVIAKDLFPSLSKGFIGKSTGRDHAGVIHSISTIQGTKDIDKNFAKYYNELRARVINELFVKDNGKYYDVDHMIDFILGSPTHKTKMIKKLHNLK
jgi:hypothetical protein